MIKQSWPDKKKCLPAVQPYYDERGELIESQGLVFRGEQLVVPLSLRKDMLNQLHSNIFSPGPPTHSQMDPGALRYGRIGPRLCEPVGHELETLSTTTGATTTAYRKHIFCSGHAQKLNN